MDFIQSSNKQIDKFGAGKHGFSAGNPTAGVLATFFTNTWADGVQQEIINVIEAAGLVPSGASLSQLNQALGILFGTGRLLGVKVFKVAGTSVLNTTPGTKAILVRGCGGGGGSAGCEATSASEASLCAGGAGGAYGEGYYTSGFNGITVTVGAGGAAGPAGPGSGSPGGTSSLGSLLSLSGGLGSVSNRVGATNYGVAVGPEGGSIITGANIFAQVGGRGQLGLSFIASRTGGEGGASGFGSGGAGGGSTGPGNPGVNPGSGGGGGGQSPNGVAFGGRAGAPGQFLIYELG